MEDRKIAKTFFDIAPLSYYTNRLSIFLITGGWALGMYYVWRICTFGSSVSEGVVDYPALWDVATAVSLLSSVSTGLLAFVVFTPNQSYALVSKALGKAKPEN